MPSPPRAARVKGASLAARQRECAERVWFAYCCRRCQVARRALGIGGHAEEAAADAHLVLEDLERLHQPRHAARRQAEAGQAPEADRLRAERDCLDDVGAAHEAAVDPYLGLA